MRVTVNWLKDYVNFDLPPERLAEILTMAGIEIDAIERPGKLLDGLVTARVHSVRPIVDSDHLKLCEVEVGGNKHQVVCGAPNVREDLVTAYAPVGVTLAGGQTMKETEIRGAKSSGMLLSVRDAGIGDDHSGIWEFPDDVATGQDLATAAMMDDAVLEFTVTANRGDCLSHLGIAREIAALTGQRVRLPKSRPQRVGGKIDEHIRIDIKQPEWCRRYTGMMVRDVEIGPSPLWMQSRLRMVGIRPINNIVDVTNYVLMEFGQPLHAFDHERLTHHHIIVRAAKDGEKMDTLDGERRTLSADNLLICDGEAPVAIAGVMGGLNSEVIDETRHVFIESAYFDPINVRKTSSALGLTTESSYRFARGVDSEGLVHALHRAAYLMEETGGGEIISGYIDNYPKPIPRAETNLRVSRTNAVLGMNLKEARISEILLSLGMEVQRVNEDLFRVTVPPYRTEVYREIDVIEEVARIEGYDKIPTSFPKVPLYSPPPDEFRTFRNGLSNRMVSLGFQEVMNFAFDSTVRQDRFLMPGAEPDYVGVLNPATEEAAVMRRSLVAGLVKNLKHNLSFGLQDVKIFELRPVFDRDEKGDIVERYRLAALMNGHIRAASWNLTPAVVDFFDLKGVLETLFTTEGIAGVGFERTTIDFLHPGKTASIVAGGKALGFVGALHPDVMRSLDLSGEPVVFELDIADLHKLSKVRLKYEKESRFPSALRDLAVVVDEDVAAGRLLEVIEGLGIDLLCEVNLFDVYRGERIGAGSKSLAFSLRFQASDRSLTDEEVSVQYERIVSTLETEVGARLRQ